MEKSHGAALPNLVMLRFKGGGKTKRFALALSVFLPSCQRDQEEIAVPQPAPKPHRSPTKRPISPLIIWRAARPNEIAAARSVIQQQFRAFRNDDYQSALELLAPEMRNGEQKPDRLRALIVNRYPEFARVARVRWSRADTASNGTISMRLRFVDKNGSVVGANYTLRPLENRYLISGIRSWPLNYGEPSKRFPNPTNENEALERFFRNPHAAE